MEEALPSSFTFYEFVVGRFLYAAANSAIRCNRWYETRFILSAFALYMTWRSEPVHSPAIGRIRVGPPGPSAMKRSPLPPGELVRGAVGELQGAGRWPAARARPHPPRLSNDAAGRVALDRADRKPRQATVSLGTMVRARQSSSGIGQAEKVRAPRFLATPDDLALLNRRQSDSNPRLLGRARNADVPLVRHRIGDDPTGRRLAVRGLRSRRRARDADVLLLRHGIGFRTARRCLAVGGLRSRRRARNADILLFRHRISHGSAGRRGR
jgi:hypothetical protein